MKPFFTGVLCANVALLFENLATHGDNRWRISALFVFVAGAALLMLGEEKR